MCVLCCLFVVLLLCVVCWCGCWFWTLRFPLAPDPPADHPAPDPLRWTTPRLTAQNFALFFLLLPLHFRSFCLSLGVFSVNFGGVFEGRDRHMCTLGVLWLLCEAPRSRRGFTRGSRPSKNTTKIQREDTQRETTRVKMEREGGKKKSAKFWASHLSGTLRRPTLRGPTLRGPTMTHQI